MTVKGTALNGDGSIFADGNFHWQGVGQPETASTNSSGYFEVELTPGTWQPDKVVIVTEVVVD